jgi:hypothetical protein
METTVPKPFVFVLMPFAEEFDDIYKFGIKGAADDVGAYADRLDEQIFAEGMLDRIFNQISKADVIVADMSGRNPNVFYEVGYAHALGKIVLLLTRSSDDIPFDLKHRQHTVYGGKIDVLRSELAPRIQWAILEGKKRYSSIGAERFSLRLSGINLAVGPSTSESPIVRGTTTNDQFTLQLQIRNDSLNGIAGISHVYLFSPADCPVAPIEYGMYQTGSSMTFGPLWSSSGPTFSSTPSTLPALDASQVDATDGLTRQYRLPIQFGALPPGTVEQSAINMMFSRGQTEVNALFRLRVHTETQFHDFHFRLEIEKATTPQAKDDDI